MTEAFSINREFDFVRLDGLRRATGRPPHEWDIYIVKELIDNALDADEKLWQADRAKFPQITVRVEYVKIAEDQSQQLFVQVHNRAIFPITQLANIFATQWYTSRKAFIKGLMRGALGNALKTLLGIPYALRYRVAGDWLPELKPLSILCQGKEYQPRYMVDGTAQTIRFDYSAISRRHILGTVISVGVDAFDQERPRTLADMQRLAAHYHLVNPHARFEWTVEIEDQEWTEVYEPDAAWDSKFQGLTPMQWYVPAAFQDLLGALYRQHCTANERNALPLIAITRHFAGFADKLTTAVQVALGQDSLTKADIEGLTAVRLYKILVKHSPRCKAATLGCIGRAHLTQVLAEIVPVDGEVLYERISDDIDPSTPFVIELAAAYLPEGLEREIWTAVNFTPTYGDPFLRAWLHAPIQPDDPVLGLRGLLDAYGLGHDAPVVLYMHLICPNVEYHEFSKTDINHLPFKQALGDVLDRLLTNLQRRREEAELRLEQTIFQALDAILATLGPQERFIFDQLLAKLRAQLGEHLEFAAWLSRPDTEARLRAYITSYQSQNPILTQRVARTAAGMLSIPLHPDRHFTLLVEHVSRDLLARHHVNKVFYVQGAALEPVVIENGWLCQMDMALWHNLPSLNALQTPLIQLVSQCDLPILVLHDATPSGQAVVTQMREWLTKAAGDPHRVIDLGLNTPDEVGVPPSHTRLIEMMPRELSNWLTTRFTDLGLPAKWLPDAAQIRRDISQLVEQAVQNSLWEGIKQQLAVAQLLIDLNQQLGLTDMMMSKALDEELQRRLRQATCADAYTTLLEEQANQFYADFMRQRGLDLRALLQAHITRMKNEWE